MTVGYLDPKLTVSIVLAQASAQARSFSVLYLPTPGTCSFSETVKRYASPTDVATSLAASEISATTAAALNAAFALDRKPDQIAVAKIAAGTQQVFTFRLQGTIVDGETFTVTVDGLATTYTATGGDVDTDVMSGLETALGTALSGTHTINYVGDDITITNVVGTNPSQVLTTTDSAAATYTTSAVTTPASSLSDALDTVLAADDDWYALVSELNATGFQIAAAAWAETNSKFFWPQSADARLLTGDAAGIGAIVSDASRNYSAVLHHDDDAERLALLGAARWLSFDPDLGPTSPTWSNLTGITTNADLTTSGVAALEADNVAYYSGFRGSLRLSEVKTGSGISARTRLLMDWLEDRIGTDVANVFTRAGATGRPIPYTDEGFARIVAVVQARLDRAVELGWLRVVLDPVSGQRLSPLASAPRVSAVSAGDLAAKRIPVTFIAHDAGEVTSAAISGTLTDATTI